MKPFFIAVEGIDGSGKSTQTKLLAEKLEQNTVPFHHTCEPTKNPIGKMIREIFAGKQQADEYTIASLFLADRLEHILNPNDGILSFLDKNINVISDRYYFSSYAYHSVHVEMDWIIECNKKCTELLKPTATIFVDVSPEICMERITARNESLELYENLENLKKVRDNYYKSFELLKNKENIIIIDGNKSINEVSDSIWNSVKQFI